MPLFGVNQLLFCLAGLDVVLIVLLMFEERASGARYFKIGKATSLPSRIKQFGPCELVAHDVRTDSQVALK